MPKCLLLVDDDARNLLALDALLRPFGHRLVHAHDGLEAIELFHEVHPEIVLCDLSMPSIDGIEVLRRIRAHETTGHTPFILLTAHTDRESRLRALRAGADEFIEKPIDEAVLTARLRTLLRLKESRDALDRAHAELTTRHASLERLQREQRELTEFIVHDLKAPLSVARTTLEWLADGPAERREDEADALGDVRRAIGRVESMVEDLLWASRLEQPGFAVRKREVELDPLLDDVVDRYARAAELRRIRLVRPEPSRARIEGDPRLLQRVLENLLDNSLRYTPSCGRVCIAAALEDGVEIRVSNDGPAIPAGERARIFEKFVRGTAERPRAGNAGLGLYFCKRAVQAHDGDIGVVDVPGWATSFRIWLPRASGDDSALSIH
jgi:signal transduction histidine kinase